MQKRMPLTIDGRDVHISVIRAYNATPETVWKHIKAKIGNGLWFTVQPSEQLSEVDKRKLLNSLINRAWNAGYTADMLQVWMTEAEGVCFRWAGGKAPESDEIERNRRERLETRRIKQKATRKAKKNEKNESE